MTALPDLDGVTLVTGTDTDVGKTVATAVLAAVLRHRSRDVAVCKPAQTGLASGEPGDVAVVGRLSGLAPARLHEFVRLPEPLAPTTAGRRAGVRLPSVAEHAARIVALASEHPAVLVEGAGGVLVGLDAAGRGLLALADALADAGVRPRFVVVARAGLGTLNHTALTAGAIRAAGHDLAGVIVGAWPERPGLAESCNLAVLPDAADAPLLAVLPAGIGDDPARVAELARGLA